MITLIPLLLVVGLIAAVLLIPVLRQMRQELIGWSEVSVGTQNHHDVTLAAPRLESLAKPITAWLNT